MAEKGTEEANEATPLSRFGKSTLWTTDRTAIIILSCINGFMWNLYYTVAIPILPRYAKSYGFSAFGQAAVLAALQAGWFVGLPFLNKGFLKPRTMVYVGALSYALGSAIVVVHQSLWTLVISRIIEGFGSSLLTVLMTSVIAREIPQESRGFVFGLRTSIASIGMFFGPVAGGVLYPYGGLRLAMMVLTVMALCALLAFVLFTKDSWFRGYEERLTSVSASKVSIVERTIELLQDRNLPWLLLTHHLGWTFMGLMFMAMPQYMVNELNLSSIMTSTFWLVCDIFKASSVFAGGLISDSFQPWYVLYTTLTLQHICQLILGLQTMFFPASTLSFLIACCLIFASGVSSMASPALLKIMTTLESHPSLQNRHEEVLSMMDFACAVALMLGPFYASFLYESAGFTPLILTFAIVSLLADLSSAYATRALRIGPAEAEDWRIADWERGISG